MAALAQAEVALLKAAQKGDLVTLTRVVAEGVDIEAKDAVSAALPDANTPLRLRPPPSPPAAPLLSRPHRRR